MLVFLIESYIKYGDRQEKEHPRHLDHKKTVRLIQRTRFQRKSSQVKMQK